LAGISRAGIRANTGTGLKFHVGKIRTSVPA
jgi:hypothetical protein